MLCVCMFCAVSLDISVFVSQLLFPAWLFVCVSLILWYHCDDKHITETNLLILSNNIYLMFYAKEIDIGTQVSECLANKNVLRMQGGHKPFCYVAISFSPKHYLMCSRFCLVWSLLLCIRETDGFAWLYVCVCLGLVTCVFYLTHSVLACFMKDANFYCHLFIQRVIIFKIILCDIIVID